MTTTDGAGALRLRSGVVRSVQYLAALLATAFIAGCDQGLIPPTKPPTTSLPAACSDTSDDGSEKLPSDATKLFEASGGPSETILVFVQGGPLGTLVKTTDPPMNGFEHFGAYADSRIAVVHQLQTLEPELLERPGDTLDKETIGKELDLSVVMLRRTVCHFKERHRRVVVMGHSFGAFLVARHLAKHGADLADAYVIMAGRLDMPMEVVEGFFAGITYELENGLTPAVVPDDDNALTSARERMLAVSGWDRYTERLADTDLSKVIYVYGASDRLVGRLSEGEVTFLQTQHAHVIAIVGSATGSVPADRTVIADGEQGGSHTSMFDQEDAGTAIAAKLDALLGR